MGNAAERSTASASGHNLQRAGAVCTLLASLVSAACDAYDTRLLDLPRGAEPHDDAGSRDAASSASDASLPIADARAPGSGQTGSGSAMNDASSDGGAAAMESGTPFTVDAAGAATDGGLAADAEVQDDSGSEVDAEAPDGAADDPVEPVVCGNGRIDEGERCDIGINPGQAGSCPSECLPLAPCMPQQVIGTLCETQCAPLQVSCRNGDGCCPQGCNAASDDDCSPTCGDGIVQSGAGETCEPKTAMECLTQSDCSDSDPCTQDLLSGSPANCNTRCDHPPVTELRGGDGCCPRVTGANANTDSDCQAVCGNGVVEAAEECDGPLGCDDRCQLTVTADQFRCLNDYPADACRRCECIECTDLALDCFDSGNATIDQHCTAVETCGRNANCANRVCYCGTSLLCAFPNGPCRSVIERAAGTTAPLEVDRIANTPGTALYRADQLAYCSVQRCSAVCP